MTLYHFSCSFFFSFLLKGDYKAAEPLLKAAQEAYDAHKGPHHVSTLSVVRERALLLVHDKRFKEALCCLQSLATRQAKVFVIFFSLSSFFGFCSPQLLQYKETLCCLHTTYTCSISFFFSCSPPPKLCLHELEKNSQCPIITVYLLPYQYITIQPLRSVTLR